VTPPPAFSFVRQFEPAPTRSFAVDRHYLVCVSSGALRLESAGTSWTLPPARAALIAAGHAVDIAIPLPTVTSSVLFDRDVAPMPATPLAVFDLTPLARALITECGRWGEDAGELTPYATSMFAALAACVWELALTPSRARRPTGRSAEVRRAIALTEATMADDPTIDRIASDVGLTSRTLARRFQDELGMTWRATLRRVRLLRAVELLAADDGRSVIDVAVRVGYSSLSAFNAGFLDLVGQTPSQFRAGFRPSRPASQIPGDSGCT